MSAIAGILDRSGRSVETSVLKSMGRSMAHRGPDGSDEWASGNVGLGHRRLRTVAGPAGPSHDSVGELQTLRVTFDGRLDNVSELQAALRGTSRSASADQESALVAAAYRRWGEECPRRLRGDFAFALWDERRQSLFCARDCFGARPLYYCDTQSRFAFASELRALRRLPDGPHRISEGRIADYLVGDLEGIDKVSTPFTDICRLPPAHSMTVGPRGTSIRRYWAPDATTEVRHADPDEYAQEYLHLLSQAVERCLKAEGPVSVMLSGGLDSSAIAALAGRFTVGHGLALVHAVSGVNPGDPACVETGCVRMASRLPGVDPHHVRPEHLAGLVTSIDRLLYDADEYFDSWSMHLPLTMYARAQQLGHRVMLDGVDGDIVTSIGHQYLSCLMRQGDWAKALHESSALATYTDIPGWRLLYRYGRGVFVPGAARRLWRRLTRVRLREAIAASIINTDFAARVAVLDRLDTMRQNEAPRSVTCADLCTAALDAPLVPAALGRYDRLASAHAIEARHPLFDRDLVDFCLSLPWNQKCRDGRRKWGLRTAMQGILPRDLCWRADFEHLGDQFSRAWFALKRDEMLDFLDGHVHEIQDVVSVPIVREAHEAYEKTQDVRQGFKVWQAFSLWLWLKRNA